MAALIDLRTRLQQNIAEPISATGWFTPSAANDWINAAIEAVFLKMVTVNPDYFGTKTTTLSFVSGTQEYSLSVTPFELRRVEVTDLGQPYFLTEADVSEKHTYQEDGEPSAFYWYMDYSGANPALKIGLIPKPTRTATNNVTVYYVPRPRVLANDSDTPDLPSEFVELAILWATIMALRTDQRPAGDFQAEFNFRLTNMLVLASRGRSGGPTYVTYIPE